MTQYESANFPVIAQNEDYVVQLVPYDNSWMTGNIVGEDFTGRDEDRTAFAHDVLDSMEEVPQGSRNSSTCTDSRKRVQLLDGTQPVEVSEQLVGATSVAGFRIAESLGERFYPDLNMSVGDRIRYTFDFLCANGEFVRTHEKCGAAAGLLAVMGNEIVFGPHEGFRSRMGVILPEGVYDPRVHRKELLNLDLRLKRGLYVGYSDQLITDNVLAVSGEAGVEQYLDDGRGEHGHVEGIIGIVKHTIGGIALNPNKFALKTGGAQAFGVNCSKKEDLALKFSNGGQDEEAYVGSWHAVTSYSAAGHGTLARNQETWLIDRAA